MTWYSDNGVDRALSIILPAFGYAVDVGANNGTFNSNTLYFEDNGWEVLCIEANPLLAEEGRARRKRWRDVACGRENGTGTFRMVGGHPSWASSSALVTDGRLPHDGSGVVPNPDERELIDIKVPIRRLDELIEEAEFPRVDFLTIDVEGSEPEVMAGFTIERWKPQVIVLEWVETAKPLSIPDGYSLFERKLFDNIYTRNNA